MAVALIEAFGIFTGATVSFSRMVPILLSLTRVLVLAQQRLKAARIFSWLSAAAILLVAGIGIAKIVIHYTMKVRLDQAQSEPLAQRALGHTHRFLHQVSRRRGLCLGESTFPACRYPPP